jgi:integrase
MRVTGADVLRYAQLRLKAQAAPATINRELAALRAGYRLGLDNDVIMPMPRIKLLPENNVRKGFAETKQVEVICKRLAADVADGVRFAFSTGWRRPEVFTITWSQVDWNGGFDRLVFHRSRRPIHSFRRPWKKSCEKAGLPGLLFHDRRRSAVRNLERASVPRTVAMKLTRHKTESIYRRYAIVAEADLKEAGAKLAALGDGGQVSQATT